MNLYPYIISFLLILLIIACFKLRKGLRETRRIEKFLSKSTRLFQPEKSTNNFNPKIGIFTLENRELELLEYHTKSIQDYADRYGYKRTLLDTYSSPRELPVYWWKMEAMLDYMGENSDLEYVVWLDSDVIITHPEVSLKYLLEKAPDASVFIARDFPEEAFLPYCAGVFIIKNNERGKQFLSDCIDVYMNREKCQKNGKYTLAGEWAGSCYEQGVMNELLNTTYKNDVFEIPEAFIVNISEPAFAQVILHCPGDKNKGYEIFKKFYTEYIEHLPIEKQSPLKIAILLTACVKGDENRLKMYEDNLDKWLGTKFDIFTVESSGVELNSKASKKPKQYTFKQESPFSNRDPSLSEKESLLKAFDNLPLKDYDIIFKVTCKYFSPEFEAITDYIPKDAQLVFQNQCEKPGTQNSEVVGIQPGIFKEVINRIDSQHSFEDVLGSIGKKYKTYRIKPLSIYRKTKRSDGSVLKYL